MKTQTAMNQEVNHRRSHLTDSPFLFGHRPVSATESFSGNIENFIGMAMVPTGLVGPLAVKGAAANGDFMVPLSTTEGALVASYNRGAKACREAGGASSVCVSQGVQRCPVFKFRDLAQAIIFADWVSTQMLVFHEITAQTSRFAQLQSVRANHEGNHLTLTFEFTTGDASGQNMVTFCTDNICRFLMEKAPVKPLLWFIEGNYAGDKKATALSFSNVRGKKVVSEVEIPRHILENTLKTNAAALSDYWVSSTVGVVQSGAIGAQGHYANGLAALFIATGQDVACVSEASVGITRMEARPNGSLYASVTLPNLIVGTVGGGTGLPTQRECLEMMGCFGEGGAVRFAEIAGALVLAGELSIAAALSAGHFSSAHQKLGRIHSK